MKEGEIARLEEGNIGRERKCSADQGMGGWGVGGEECDKGRKTELRETKRENVQSRGGMYLSALCRSSSGHLLPYIKGFALISMPLHPSTGWGGGCLCVHPYKL